MKFLINENIVFQPEQQRLKNTETGAETELSFVDTQLLAFLLHHSGKVSTRNELLEKVFIRNNVSATDGNLNRHIMLLRKTLAELRCEEEVIITVPKTGFKTGNVTVCQTDADNGSETEDENTPVNELPLQEDIPAVLIPRKEGLISGRYSILAFLSLCFLLTAMGYYFLATGGHIPHPDVSIVKTERYQNCEFAYTRGTRYSPPVSVINDMNRQGETVSCLEPVKITLWRNITPTQEWAFTTICDSLKKCRGIYVYTQK